MKTYNVTITGKTPMIHHWDNIEWSDEMKAWEADPANKKTSVKGDDRSPAHRWLGGLYHDGTVVAVPQDNIMRCLMEGGAMVPVPGGKNGKTFKAQTQSGMLVGEPFWPMLVPGPSAPRQIPVAPILALKHEPDFLIHKDTAKKFGFELFVKRAKLPQGAKHVRVRPRFSEWSISGTIIVWDDQITKSVLADILKYTGLYKGLGDWRPGGKTPGPHGMFTGTID